MPAQKRPPPHPQSLSDDQPGDSDDPSSPTLEMQEQEHQDEEALPIAEGEENPPRTPPQEQDGREGGGAGESEDEARYTDYLITVEHICSVCHHGCVFVFVRLTDIRKEVQCPICLGIIRKTRTVMECLHRFCRACIDKSMRLGNNECPACRTHCASRRSLRDDPNYDALIAAIYPDIDKYEEEELAFDEEEMSRNKKLQESIAEIFQRQLEALGRKRSTSRTTTTAFSRRSLGNYRNHSNGKGGNDGCDATVAAFDDEVEENANDVGKSYSSADEPSPDRRTKRLKRWSAPRSSPARTTPHADACNDEILDHETNRENIRSSPLQTGSKEMLAWGKNGARSQTRHGIVSGSNGRMAKGGRVTKLVDYFRSLDDNDDECVVHLNLVPLDKEKVPNLQQPFLCCRPTMSIRHLREYIALRICIPAEEVEIHASTPQGGVAASEALNSTGAAYSEPSLRLQKLEGQESLGTLHSSFTSDQGELVLVYHLKIQT